MPSSVEYSASADARRRAWAAVGVHLDELSTAMTERGVRIEEELTLPDLLADLSA